MYFRQAIQNDQNNADGYYNLAANFHRQWKVHGRQSDLQQAESYYQQGLARNPQHADGYRGLAVLLVEQGKARKRSRCWITGLPAPSGAEPRIELAHLYEEFGDKESAKGKLIDAVALAPENSRTLLRSEKSARSRATRFKRWPTTGARSRTTPTSQQSPRTVAALQASGFGTPNFSAPTDTRWVNAPRRNRAVAFWLASYTDALKLTRQFVAGECATVSLTV